jgi:SET domain
MFIRTEVRESGIFGKGLFPLEAVARGKIVCFFAIGAQMISEERFLAAVASGEQHIVRTGTRYVGKYFTIGNEAEPYTYLNHSFEPNLLCHCGIVIARRAIAAQEELTLDYRTLIDDTELGTYADAASGQTIRGFGPAETFVRTAREFAAIIEDCGGWTG